MLFTCPPQPRVGARSPDLNLLADPLAWGGLGLSLCYRGSLIRAPSPQQDRSETPRPAIKTTAPEHAQYVEITLSR